MEYLSVSDDTHNKIVNHHNDPNNPDHFLPETGQYPGVSGFFADEESASKHFTDEGKFDSVSYGHAAQQAPYFNEQLADQCAARNETYYPDYNGHLDCFRVNPEKMQEHFGTPDFHAAMSKCTENTPWGEGGANQGYNPYINEMINKGCLEYVPEKSKTCDNNACKDYYSRKSQASTQASEVSNYIEQNNIKGETGQKIGYNELPQNNTIDNSSNNYSNSSSNITSQNVAATTGGGSNAPPVTATDNTNTSGNTICGTVDSDSKSGFYNAKVASSDNDDSSTLAQAKPNDGFGIQ